MNYLCCFHLEPSHASWHSYKRTSRQLWSRFDFHRCLYCPYEVVN